MKRIWFAIIFLALCIGLCIGEQIYVKQVFYDLDEKISIAQQYSNKDELKNSLKEISDYWTKYNDILFALSYQSNLDDLSVAINSLNYNDDDIDTKLLELKAYSKVFYENQKLSPENIF